MTTKPKKPKYLDVTVERSSWKSEYAYVSSVPISNLPPALVCIKWLYKAGCPKITRKPIVVRITVRAKP